MFAFDLHIHSCLSPCGDLDASPRAIVQKAKSAGLNGIMLADHNSSRNSPALAEACRREGLSCLFGLEITSAEEVHSLAVFDTLEQAAAMTEICYAALPKRVNQPEVFGYQAVVDADDNVEELEWRLLGAPTRLPLHEVGEHIHKLGGLFIAAHIDRPVFSVTSQLGGLAGDEGFDAVELSRHAVLDAWRGKTLGLPVIRSSDAHYLNDIGTIRSEADLSAFSTQALKAALNRLPRPATL
ncbi:MAG TPA: PHP domain-containing protein [Kiritimatiellia bacterium]|mgnify:FL=1|nr:PHP domain-containing protein [Kiritimatiellia bacterium]HRU71202.1 PHP domain-containing protein [Kiritimatiellia bacterium]